MVLPRFLWARSCALIPAGQQSPEFVHFSPFLLAELAKRGSDAPRGPQIAFCAEFGNPNLTTLRNLGVAKAAPSGWVNPMTQRFDIHIGNKADGYLILTVPAGEMPPAVRWPEQFRKVASEVPCGGRYGGWIDWPAALRAIARQGYSLQGLAVEFIESV